MKIDSLCDWTIVKEISDIGAIDAMVDLSSVRRPFFLSEIPKFMNTVKALKTVMVRKKKKKELSLFSSENNILLIMPRLRKPKVSVRPENNY